MKKSVLTRDGLVQLWDSISTLFVRKETGKGLSVNNFTNKHKEKLEGIQAKAQVNIIETISVNGSVITNVDKNINIFVPTDNLEIANGAGYLNEAEVRGIVSSAGHLKRVIAEMLPDENIDLDTIYMVKNTVESENDVYIEYMYINDAWEIIGKTDVDLSGYVRKENIEELTEEEIDAICTESSTEEV